MIHIKYYLQKLLGLILNKPVFKKGRTTGYSLVKSERSNVTIAENTNIVAPFYIKDVSLGAYSYISKNCNITNTSIGKFCSIGPNFCCGLGIHPINGISTAPMFYSVSKQNGLTLVLKNKVEESKHTVIENDVFIGSNVTVLDGVTIGNGAVIGAGAVVTGDIPPYAVAVGVPAKITKYRFDKETINNLLKSEWWNLEKDKLHEIEKHFFEVKNFIKFHA
jgi:virginiamycin A acetyltransferase